MRGLGWAVPRYNGWEIIQNAGGPLVRIADVPEVTEYNKLAESHRELFKTVTVLLQCVAGSISAPAQLTAVLAAKDVLERTEREMPNR